MWSRYSVTIILKKLSFSLHFSRLVLRNLLLPLVLRMLLFLVLCCSLGYLAARACAFKYECFASTPTGKFARKALIANSHYDRLSVLSREMLSISNMKSAEVKKYVQDSEKKWLCSPIIIPIGACECHFNGELPLQTDSIISTAIAAEVCRRSGVILGPPIDFGVSHLMMQSKGTVSLRKSTLTALLTDIIWSLSLSSSFTHVFFINGHSHNCMPLKEAIRDIKRGPAPRDFIMNRDGERGMKETAGGGDGGHEDPKKNLCVSYACYYASKKCRCLVRNLYSSRSGQVGKWPSIVEENAILDYLETRDSQPSPWYPTPSSNTTMLLPSTPVRPKPNGESAAKGEQIFEMAVSEMMAKLGDFMAKVTEHDE